MNNDFGGLKSNGQYLFEDSNGVTTTNCKVQGRILVVVESRTPTIVVDTNTGESFSSRVTMMKEALAFQGPVAVAINANYWEYQLYNSGICPQDPVLAPPSHAWITRCSWWDTTTPTFRRTGKSRIVGVHAGRERLREAIAGTGRSLGTGWSSRSAQCAFGSRQSAFVVSLSLLSQCSGHAIDTYGSYCLL